MHRGKIYKSYDIVASSEMFSIKITGDSIKNEHCHTVYEEVINKESKRSRNFEIIHVRKEESHNYA